MRFSESWLRELVNPDIDTDALSHQLSMAGLEVDSVEKAAPGFHGVVVGEVLTKEQHPDADKLSVTSVDVGAGAPLQIVCGASNVAAGMRVPVATVGAVLPGGFAIKKAKLRGVESLGMICSAAELGLAESSDGIMPLPADAPPGADFRDWLNLDDALIEVDLTPDRGDCLSMIGVARDISALNSCDLTLPHFADVEPVVDDAMRVDLDASEACPRYLCRVIRGIDPTAETPLWMQEKLRRGGIRSLGPVVDVTNYILLELGQPMHGFDLAKIDGRIRVRMAAPGETLALLDGEEVEMNAQTLVIADNAKALAMAGIMGGADSGVTVETSDILLESAFFSPLAITGKARHYGMHTDSSHRFERGVDPALQGRAIERATRLLLDIVGGQPGPVTEALAEGFSLARDAIMLRKSRIRRLLGIDLDDGRVISILTRLGMAVEPADGGWLVTPPTWRFDVAIEADLIEELARIHGYDNIPSTHGHQPLTMHLPPESGFSLARARSLLDSRDYQEVISYSFISPETADALDPQGERIELANPISSDMAVMRPTIWAGLLETAKHNIARQQSRLRIYESGLKFTSQDNEIQQKKCLSGLLFGDLVQEQWAQQTRPVDFFDLKGDVEAILALTGAVDEFSFSVEAHPALHPGQSARIRRGDAHVGWLGLIHPALEKSIGFKGKAYLFEIELESLDEGRVPAFEPISKFPSIRRDLAILVDRDVAFADVKRVIREASPEIVRDIRLFDVYEGENIESHRKSLALSLILQEKSRTLEDHEVQRASETVLDALNDKLGARLRES
ncbi:MAG: phenylalanine--tRNA ligase subunit beta [Gammaproteobacteria bacterium]